MVWGRKCCDGGDGGRGLIVDGDGWALGLVVSMSCSGTYIVESVVAVVVKRNNCSMLSDIFYQNPGFLH